MSHAEDMAGDEVTGRTARLAMLEIRTEAGEKANQDVIGVQSTLQKLKWLVATALTVGVFVNVGIWLNDKWQHMATKDAVAEHGEEIQRLREWQRQVDAHEQARDDTMHRMADQVDDIHRYFMRGKK